MGHPQDQYRDVVSQSQQAFAGAVDAWTKTLEQSVGAFRSVRVSVDPQQVVGQAFDVVQRVLQLQRDLVTSLLSSVHGGAAAAAGQPTGAATTSPAEPA